MKHIRRYEHLVFLLILGIAAALRLWKLELMQFHYDDGISMIYGLQILDGQWRLSGLKSSFGFYNPPLFIYLVSLAMLVSKDPMFIGGLVALLNTVAVAAVYLAARRCFGYHAAWVAMLMMACSPAAIFASRRVYAQDCVPVLACLVFLFAVRMFQDGKKRDTFITMFLAVCLAQVHYSGMLLLGVLCLAWATIRTRLSWKPLALGVAAATLPLIPFLVHLYGTGFEDVRAVLQTVAGGANGGGGSRLDVLRFGYNLTSDTDVDWILGPVFHHMESILPGRVILKHLLNILVVVSLVLLVPAWRRPGSGEANRYELGRCREDIVARLIICWMGFPVLVYFLTGIRMFPSYLFILYPVPFLLVGRLAERVMNPGGARRPWRFPPVVLVGAWCLYHFGFYAGSLFVQEQAEKEQAPYAPLRDQVAAAKLIADHIVAGETQVLQNFWEPGTGVHYNYTYLVHWQYDPDHHGPLYSTDHPNPRVWFRIIDYPFLREHEHESCVWEMVRRVRFHDFGALRLYHETRPE